MRNVSQRRQSKIFDVLKVMIGDFNMCKNRFKTNIFSNLSKIFKCIMNLDSKYIFISFVYTIIGGVLPSLSIITMQRIINKIQTGSDLKSTALIIFLYLGIEIFSIISSNIISYYNSSFSLKFSLKSSERILFKASKLSLSDYENSKTYDLINRAQNGGGTRLLDYYFEFTNIIKQFITLISYLLILLTFRFWLVFAIIVLPFVRYIISNNYNRKSFNIIKKRTNEQRKNWYITYLLTYGSFFKELKIFNLFNYFIKKYRNFNEKFNDEDLQLSKDRTITNSFLSLLDIIIDGMLLFYILKMGIDGNILIGSVMMYVSTLTDSKEGISMILTGISNLINESLFIDQLFEYLNLPEENNSGKIKIDLIKSIELRDVSFKYENDDKYVLKNINLKINGDEKVALLGVNGSGKTTLIKLIMGFYQNYEGEILINEINLELIDRLSLLDRISTLFQDFAKYETTLRKNIAFGNLEILNKNEDLNIILNKFKINDMLNENEIELDTQLGSLFDNGINLSMGQWQKVALARAFTKNSDLYILDEPNASMDLITEYEIFELYESILENKMGIIIIHKLNNITKIVDRIIVLDEGELVESGTHENLIKNNKLYYRLYNLNKI